MKRANNILIAIIIFLTIIIIGLVTLLILTLLNIKEKPFDKVEPVDITVNGNVMSFLDTTISNSGDSYYNILEASNILDEDAFYYIIQYLYANNIYTKNNDEYIFNQSDIIEYAKKYVLKDNFDYISINPNFRYDSINKTFITKLQPIGPKAYILKSIDIYEKTETTASVILEIEGSYDETGIRIWEKYNIIVNTKDNDYKIDSIKKIK